MKTLEGWKFIIYTLIEKNYKDRKFFLSEIYSFEPYFKLVYPKNNYIKEKIRQILQQLRDLNLLNFVKPGEYELIYYSKEVEETIHENQTVYLLANDSIPGWVKIGRTNSIARRLKELYNTSVPTPFKLIDSIETNSEEQSTLLEKTIHSLIDEINPNLRKNTEAKRREFFQMDEEKGRNVFKLVTKITGIETII